MDFFKLAKRFNKDEDGAVTVDWVVLTAAIVGLGVAVLASVRTATEGLGDRIAAEIDATIVGDGTGGTSTSTSTDTSGGGA